MRIIRYPEKNEWKTLLERPKTSRSEVVSTAQSVLEAVKARGDEAVREFAKKFDKVDRLTLRISKEELSAGALKTPQALREAIVVASKNIQKFHLSQQRKEEIVETMPGIRCWRRSIPLRSVGIYVPGGTAPLFSTALMLGVPAKIAGVPRIALGTPLNREGEIASPIAFVATLLGIDEVYGIGGAQAIGALAYGTESIPRVEKVLGPGNAYVTAAKELVMREGIPIDMAAGPSEVFIIGDEGANADYIAADLLSQAEHGPDSQVIFVTESERLLNSVVSEVTRQLESLPRREIALKALAESKAILVENLQTAVELSNLYAPEHLVLAVKEPETLQEGVRAAGSVFLGAFSPVTVGDYASGTNHTLPTAGGARFQGGISVDSFVKKVTFQSLTREGLQNVAPTVTIMAEGEGLLAHARAVAIRVGEGNR